MITSLFFRDITFSKQSKVSQRGYSWAFAGYFGQSGLETWLANKAYNGITGNETLWLIKGVNDREDVNFAKFTKVSFDIRGKKELSKK